jgi:hypothetical protein
MGLERGPNKNYIPTFYDSFDKVPKDSQGVPTAPIIQAQYQPRVAIDATGTDIVLVLAMSSGKAWFRDPVAGDIVPIDMKNWAYGISINLDFAGIERADIDGHMAIPPLVAQRLHDFVSNDFSISQLFVDFNSTDLMRFDPAITSVGAAGSDALQSFTFFMSAFLGGLAADPKANPYILGYTIAQTPKKLDEDKNVPPSLKPIGQTFTCYREPKVQGLSTLNFILNTAGGRGKLAPGTQPTPGNFDNNWINLGEQCDGKMTYSSYALLETLILQPFYDSYNTSIHDKVSQAVDIADKLPYEMAKRLQGPGHIVYTSSNIRGGADQYVNSYNVDLETVGSNINIVFNGRVSLRKEVGRNMGFCHADAWASGFTAWTATINLQVSKDDQGNPIVTVSKPVTQIKDHGSDHYMNTCAVAFSWIGKIIDIALSVLNIGGILDSLVSVFDALNTSVGGNFDVSVNLQNLGSSINSSLMLPAGQEFLFKVSQK